MILTVLRPSYFYPVHECARAQGADVTVLAETLQFSKQETIHRTAIKTITGRTWLSVPILRAARQGQKIFETTIDARQPWKNSHLRTLELNYKNSAFFYWYADRVFELISNAGGRLNELLCACSDFVFASLDLHTKVIGSGKLEANIVDRTERAMAWLEACGCDTYLIPPGELRLIDLERLRKNKITIQTFSFQPVLYHQQFDGFLAELSILDLLFNEGPESADLLKKYNENPSAIY